MVPTISGDDPQGPNTEQVNKHNVTIHAHLPVLRPLLPIKIKSGRILFRIVLEPFI